MNYSADLLAVQNSFGTSATVTINGTPTTVTVVFWNPTGGTPIGDAEFIGVEPLVWVR